MKQKIVIAGLALVVLGAGVFISLRKTQDSSPQQRQMSALKELRESGVITAQEYDSKVQALRTSAPAASGASKDKIAALQELRDSGVITAQEYESKVQAVQASPRPVSTSLAHNHPAGSLYRDRVRYGNGGCGSLHIQRHAQGVHPRSLAGHERQ